MFKKRAPKAPIVTPPPQGDDDDDATSPTITVSIPQDALDHQETPNRSHSTSSSRRSSIDVKHHVHQPPMPWKPWNPQKIGGTGTSETSSDPEVHKLAAISSTATSTTSHVSGTGTRIGKGPNGLKSPSMMLNIGGMFSSSSTPTTPGTPGSASSTTSQPVEARLWNAELSDPSPLSPAVPRYIPAIAGSGATGSRKMNFGGSRKSLEGYGSPNGGFRGLGQASSHSSTNQDRPPHQHHQSSSSFSRAPSTTSRSGSKKSKSKSTKTQSRYLSGASPPNKMLRDGSDITTFRIPNATSPVVQDTHRAVIFEDKSHSRGESSNGHYQGYESTRKICRDHDLGIRSFDFSEATEPGFYRDGLDGLGTDYDDDDNRKRDRRSFSRSNVGSGRFGALLRNPTRFLKARMFSLRYHRRRVHPCVRFSVLILLAGCVCFTTIQLIFYRGSENGRRASFKKAIGKRAKDLQLGGLLIGPTKPKRRISVFDVEAQNYSSQQWELETHNIQGSKLVAKVAEDYMLSKAFSGVMQPTRVIPFYFKASFRDENDDDDFHADDEIEGEHDDNSRPIDLDMSQVTITTLITPDRYGVFLKLVKQYRGPISVATRIPKGEDQDRHFQELHQFFHDHTILRKYVDLHVIVDGLDLQLNMWRNVARMFARTDYFMMLDVDFHIPSGLKHHLHDDPRMQELLASGAALVIPAFEYKVDKDPKDSKYFPDTKAALIPLLEKGNIHVFHDSFPPGHAATDTPRWMKMKSHAALEEGHRGDHPGDELNQEDYLEMEAEGEKPYKVNKFEPKYEPYIVLKKEGTPWCDERFVGYGANKAACLFEIYVSGVDFWVMPQDFLIHQYHDYPTQNRKNGRTLNKQLFVNFQQEICYTTLTRMIGTGEWYTTKADNLREQCHVFDGFLKSADQMAKEFEERHPNSLIKDPVFVAHGQRRPRVHLSGLGSSTPEIVMVDRPPHGTGHHDDRPVGLEVHDPSMSKPNGRVWGGIQVKTFYVPPPEEEDERVFDSQVGGEDGHVSSPDGHHHEQDRPHNSDLVGTKLDQFREGIIDADEDDASKFSFPKEGEREYLEQEMMRFRKLQEQWLDRGPSDLDLDLTGGGGKDGQSPERESGDKGEHQPDHPFHRDPDESFEDAARRLEERFRKLLEEQ
ncbi:hypothetical protein BG000_010029 [Podila horticola]|nr:hypothetical protein BG000_010029 [Podila horticola]